MQVGDLVKFASCMKGLENCLGIVLYENGPEAVDVMWMDKHTYLGETFKKGVSTELIEFLEVISDCRCPSEE